MCDSGSRKCRKRENIMEKNDIFMSVSDPVQNTSLQDRMRLQLFYLTSEMRSRRNDKEEGTQWINRWETNKREEGEP